MEEFSTYYLDNVAKEKFLLEVHFITSKEDLIKYDSYLEQLPENPFIKKELLPKRKDQEIGYFTLHNSANTLLVLLPFLYRKIYWDNKATGYYDIISPYGFVGPVLNSGIDEKTMKQFWEQVDEWYIQNKVVSEFIRFNFDNNYLGFTGAMVPTLKMVCGKILEENEQWQNFKPKVRNNVRKARSHGLKAKVHYKHIGKNEIHAFYEIYSKTMDRHKAESRYRYSLTFFEGFILNNPDSCALAFTYKDNKAVSVELLLLSDKVVYSFLGGTDEEYFYVRPNDLLKLKVMNWARKNEFEYYFLGGGKVEKDSLYQYKKSFFPKDNDCTFYTGRKILNKKVYNELVERNPNATKSVTNEFFPLYRYKQGQQ